LEWFCQTENKLRDAGPASIVPKVVRTQLQDHRSLNDNISSQKGRVREVTSSAKKLIRELQSDNNDSNVLKEKLEDLKDRVESVTHLSAERLSNLEQVAPLSEHFADNNEDLSKWLTEMEREVSLLTIPGVRADQILLQQEKNERLIQTVANHKPLFDKFNKTGDALAPLVSKDDSHQIHDIVDALNNRYDNLKVELRDRQLALEKALQETSKFTDKLENMLRTLKNAADQVKQSDAASAHVPKISNQIEENWAVAEDLEKREDAYVSIREAANEIISKAPSISDPAVREIKAKLEQLNDLWVDVQKEVKVRDNTLNDTLAAAEKFWAALEVVMKKLRELKDTLMTQEPVATEPDVIQKQKNELQGIRKDMDETKIDVDQVRKSGKDLITMCCDADKPEIKKHIDDLDNAWGNITALFAEREENLINAMEKAMKFHGTLQSILKYLQEAEEKQRKWKPIGSEITVVKKQIEEVKDFKDDMDSHGVDIESLKRQANEISEITSVDQTASIRNGVKNIVKRWDDLKLNTVNRQKQLENALLQLGQFEHALNELLVWIKKTQTSCEQLRIVSIFYYFYMHFKLK
jgi:DNA repair exonuclease SbcCD ATPase subunit